MREIKFRAWDKRNKRMFTVLHWDTSVLGDSIGRVGGFTGWETLAVGYDVDLMQYTGLHDKNGVEIYEGDVVYQERFSPDDPAYGYYGETFFVECDAPNGGFNLRADGVYTEIDSNTLEHLKVIGNIYENPELKTTPSSKNQELQSGGSLCPEGQGT